MKEAQKRSHIRKKVAIVMKPPALALLVIALIGIGLWKFFDSQVSAQTPISLTGCQNITSNGNYVLANNVSSSGTCFSIRGNVTSLDFNGNGKTISVSSGDALEIADFGSGTPHHVTVHDFSSTDGVRTFGNAIHHVIFEDLNVSGITVYGSDDVTIRNNTVGSGGIQVNDSDNNWHPLRPIVTNNTITGAVGHTSKLLIEIAGGKFHPCPRIDAIVTNNTVTNHRNDPPPEATGNLRVRCATHSIVTGNYFRSTGTTMSLYLRDEADDGLYENNTFWSANYEAIRIASGNDDKTYPSRNIFRNNIFRSDASPNVDTGYVYLHPNGSNNRFEYNTFIGARGGLTETVGSYGGTVFDHNTFYTTVNGNPTQLFDYSQSSPETWTNNIFSYSGTSVFSFSDWSFSRYIGNHNLFHNRAGTVSFGSQGSSLAAWRTNSGNTDDMNSIEANPLFTNVANYDFTLQAASPARGAGSGGTDIGAKPFGSEPPPICTESWTCGAWSACSNSSQSRTCTDANSCGTTTNRPPLTQSCDSTAPTVTLTAPSNGATVNGTVVVSATAADAGGLAGVTFYANGVAIGSEDTSAPYTVNWNTTGIANGSTRTLTAVARDTASNTATSTAVIVTINPPSCTESWTCGAWSACTTGTQTRTCSDANSCGTTNTRPPLSQSCIIPDVTAPVAVSNLSAR